MGGHGGLNILPQKRWNVYNFDNREKVREDEEAAAKEEQQKREQSRKRDHEFRLEQLRQARGLASTNKSGQSGQSSTAVSSSASAPEQPVKETKSKHINLFDGIRIFDPTEVEGDDKKKGFKRMKKEAVPPPKVVSAEDEKYRLGYGVAGKGVKLPWYMEKQKDNEKEDNGGDSDEEKEKSAVGNKSSGKKTLAELREERLKREKREKEREFALLQKGRQPVALMPDRYHNRRGDRYY